MFVIPEDRLPPGFADGVDRAPADPAVPRPAATVVLLRDSPDGPEALLLRRNRSSGFVPGAYVFAGGRVDEADADVRLLRRADGLAAGADPAPAYWIAAAREVFEETGVLLARDGNGVPAARGPAGRGADVAGEAAPRTVTAHDGPIAGAGADRSLAAWRDDLLEDRATLRDLLEATGRRLAFDEVVPCAHWITPVVEPRRYDTRFFLARWPTGRRVAHDAREMTDAVWAAPADALDRFRAGRLPMVFPTVRTLESLTGYDSVDAVLAAFRGRSVEPILPRLVRTDGGVGIVVD